MMYSDVTSKRLGLISENQIFITKLKTKISETNLKQTEINHFEIKNLASKFFTFLSKCKLPNTIHHQAAV